MAFLSALPSARAVPPSPTGWPLEILSWDLTSAYPGLQYEWRLGVKGGVYPYTFTLLTGPSGMTIDAKGVIRWTPASASTGNQVQVRVTDSTGAILNHSYTINATTSGFYFVATNGNDSNPGTLAQPWATIAKASATAGTGIVYVRSGTYTNAMDFEGSNAHKWIAYPGETVILDNGGAIISARKSFSVVAGFEIRNAGAKMFWAGGVNNNMIWRKNVMHGVSSTGADNPAFIFFEDGSGYRPIDGLVQYDRIVVQENVFYDLTNPNNHGGSMVCYNVKNLLYEDNEAYEIDGVGVSDKDDGYYNTFRNNVLRDCSAGVNLLCQYTQGQIEVCYNLIYNCSTSIVFGLQPGYIRDVFVHHNTLVSATNPFSFAAVTDGAQSVNFNIYGNIIENTGTGFIYRFAPVGTTGNYHYPAWVDDPVGRQVQIDNNLIWNTGTHVAGNSWGLTNKNLAAWRASSFDINSVYADPALTASYTLPSGSPYLGIYGREISTGGGSVPAAPSGLTATAVSSSQINLAWADNASNETGFKVDRKTGSGGTYAQIATPGANATTHNNSSLTASTTYYYRVRATNANGDSAWSNEANATTATGGGAPEINVTGSGVTIADGDTTPTIADHTDFGSANVSGATVTRTYTVQNTGSAALTVNSVTLSGAHAADFAVTAQPASSVAAGGSTTFSVRFDPSATGLRSATVSFGNNDTNENPYNFSIQGSGTSGSCQTATTGQGWLNVSFTTQTGTFTAEFDATPYNTMDALVALSNGAGSTYSSYACIVRFDQAGNINARNGGAYAAASTIPYTPNTTYHFRLVVNVPAHTYSIYVTPAGGSEALVGLNYAFRTEQNTVTQLNNWANYIDTTGSLEVCNFAILNLNPEINVTGSGVTIADGDTTPSATDHTDFGSVDISGATVTRTYTVQNTGNAALTVNTVTLTGEDAADFAVTAQPASSVAAGGSTIFSVRFDPSATGTRSASVSFGSNDANENPYNFNIQGTGAAPPAAIAFRSASSSAGAGSSITLNKPTGVVSGDLMLAAINLDGNVSITAPSGWTLVRTIADGMMLRIYRKTAGASEPANYTWSLGGTRFAGGIVALSGVNSTTPIQIENGVAEATTSTTHTSPAITTSGSATWLVSIFGDKATDSSTWTPPSGATERIDVRSATSSSDVSLEINTVGPVAAGSKTHTATASVSSAQAGMAIIALQP